MDKGIRIDFLSWKDHEGIHKSSMVFVLYLHIFDVINHHVYVGNVCHCAIYDFNFQKVPLPYVPIQNSYSLNKVLEMILEELCFFS